MTIVENKANNKRIRPGRSGGFAFFMGFLRHPDIVGSVVPSSRFLMRRLINAADIAHARLVLELGPGTGGTTRAILDALPEESKLLAIEIDAEFVSVIRSDPVPDPRLIVHLGSADRIQQTLKHYGLSQPNAVISGIPFSTMPPELGRRILREIWSCLAPGGHFVAYQFREHVALLGAQLLGRPEIELELFNVPPVRVYHWRKPVHEESHQRAYNTKQDQDYPLGPAIHSSERN